MPNLNAYLNLILILTVFEPWENRFAHVTTENKNIPGEKNGLLICKTLHITYFLNIKSILWQKSTAPLHQPANVNKETNSNGSILYILANKPILF